MTRLRLILALITTALVLAATSAAFDLHSAQWFEKAAPDVAQVDMARGAAAQAKLMPGAVLLAINGTPLLVQRGNERLFVPVALR